MNELNLDFLKLNSVTKFNQTTVWHSRVLTSKELFKNSIKYREFSDLQLPAAGEMGHPVFVQRIKNKKAFDSILNSEIFVLNILSYTRTENDD